MAGPACMKVRADRSSSEREKSETKGGEPSRAHDRKGEDSPGREESRADRLKPMQATPAANVDVPSCARDRSKIGKSECAKERTATADSALAQVRDSRGGPEVADSVTNSAKTRPARDRPSKGTVSSKRKNCFAGIDGSGVARSRTSKTASRRVGERTNAVEPRRTRSSASKRAPTRVQPKASGKGSGQA